MYLNCTIPHSQASVATLPERNFLDDSVSEVMVSTRDGASCPATFHQTLLADAAATAEVGGRGGAHSFQSPLRADEIVVEGCVKRKYQLKNGSRFCLPQWTRFWMILRRRKERSPTLLFYEPKHFRGLSGTRREDFRRNYSKQFDIHDCLAVPAFDKAGFKLVSPTTATIYKFHPVLGHGQPTPEEWYARLNEVLKVQETQPKDLIQL